MFGLEARVQAAGDDQVVADSGGLGADEGSDACPAQPEPVHQHSFGVRARRNRLSMIDILPRPPARVGGHRRVH
jgi:hypothetical protein